MAGRGRRLAAVLLDGVLALPLLLIAQESGYANTESVDPLGLTALAGFSVLANVQIYILATSGQTIGKRVMQIRIVDADTGCYPGWVRLVLLRSYVNGLFVAVTFGLYGLADILFIFRDDRRTLHDKLARTRVDRVGAAALGTTRASGRNVPWPPKRSWDGDENGGPVVRTRGPLSRIRRLVGRPVAELHHTLGVLFFVFTEKYAVAESCFRKAADLGLPYGQAWLGWLYLDGASPFSVKPDGHTRISEVPKDEVQAAEWLRKAAAQGLADAQFSLATMYAAGVGVQKDYAKAEQWCRQAAERGDPWAQNVLGVLHAAAHGPLKDAAEAEKWFRRAALPGRMPGRRFLLFRGRRHSGIAIAQFNLGCLSATGQKRRHADAARWLREAAEQGLGDAQNALGVMHAEGRGVPEDAEEAERRFNQAWDSDLTLVAQYNLGALCLERGADAKAWRSFQAPAEEGDPLAQSALGFLYAEGRTYGGERSKGDRLSYVRHHRRHDLEEAALWYERAVESCSALSRDGHSTTRCPSVAWRLRGPGGQPFPEPRIPPPNILAGRTTSSPSRKWRIPVLQDGWRFAYVHSRDSGPAESGPLAWFLKGAERGHAAAQHSLGRLYKHGWGVPADESKSLMWFRLAAKQGHAEAQGDLGRLYETGESVPQDYDKALKWYRRAAKRGHAHATRLLARCYATGTGAPVDKVAAARLYSVAVELGDRSAAADLRRLTSEGWNRPGVDQSGELAFDRVEWREWCRRAAEAGHAEAQALLGSSYLQDGRLDHEPSVSALRSATWAKALAWYTKAAEQGCVQGQVGLAEMYLHGYKAAVDEHGSEAARSGTSVTPGATGDIGREWKPSCEDLAEAAKWYRKAAEQEDADAQEQLGSLHRDGKGVPVDGTEAIKWCRRAARQGHDRAQQLMGFAYEEGVDRYAWSGPRDSGVLRDDVQAYAWFSLSDDPTDHKFAQETFARLRTDEERDRARLLAAKYREDYVQPFVWRRSRFRA